MPANVCKINNIKYNIYLLNDELFIHHLTIGEFIGKRNAMQLPLDLYPIACYSFIFLDRPVNQLTTNRNKRRDVKRATISLLFI